MSDNLLVHATEHYAGIYEAPGWKEAVFDSYTPLPCLGRMLFESDAEFRGYDMKLWAERTTQMYLPVSGIYR